MSDSLVVTLTFIVPLGTAAVLGGANRRIPGGVRLLLGLGAASAVAVGAAILLVRSGSHPIVVWFGGWHPRHGIVIGVDYAVDPLGAGLALLAGLLAAVALLYSQRYFGLVGGRYPALVLVFTAACVDFALSGDLFNMFVAFELVAVTGFVLTGFYSDEEAPLQGAINFAVTNTFGGLAVLFGLILLYGRTGTLNLAAMGQALAGHRPDGLVVVALALLATGFLTKAAVVPFHFWLPDAYGTAPAPACVLFAGVMSELGLFGLARVWETVFSGAVGPAAEHRVRIVLCAVGVLTALVGAAMALVQVRLRRLLGFVTVAHMGLYLVGFGLLRTTAIGAVALLAAGDGRAKAALFLAGGVVQRHRRSPDAGRRTVPIAVAAGTMALGALALADLPPFASSVGKDLLVRAAGSEGWWVETVVAVTVVATSAAVLRRAVRAWRETGGTGDESVAEVEAEESALRSALGAMSLAAPPVGLLALGVAVGLVPHLDQRVVTAASGFTDRRAYAAAVIRGKALPVAAPVVAPASTGAMLTDLAEAAGAVAVSVLLLAEGRALAATRRRGAAAVGWLRHLHTGHVGDQVTWQLVGGVAFAGLGGLALR